jgi:hypothetical protein
MKQLELPEATTSKNSNTHFEKKIVAFGEYIYIYYSGNFCTVLHTGRQDWSCRRRQHGTIVFEKNYWAEAAGVGGAPRPILLP